MDFNMIKGLVGDAAMSVSSSDKGILYVVLEDTNGAITFADTGYPKFEEVFKDYIKHEVINADKHQEYLAKLNEINNIWDKKAAYQNGRIVAIEKYTEEERAAEVEKMNEQARIDFYNKEKTIALQIVDDHKLGLNVSDVELEETKAYIGALSNGKVRTIVVRPEIFKRYEGK